MVLPMLIERTPSAEARLSDENKAFLQAMGITAVHLLASPGAGKTTLIGHTVESLVGQLRVGVIQAALSKQATDSPLDRLDLSVVRIDTGGQPYLDASMMREAMERLPLVDIDLLLIEEIGTLTLHPQRPLGETLRVVIASLPEGEDCPLRYPEPFAGADAIVLNKLDLLPHLDFDRSRFRKAVRRLNSEAPLFELSCRTGEGLEAWGAWLLEQARGGLE